MSNLALSALTVSLSAAFIIGAVVYYRGTEFKTERNGRRFVALGVMLFPVYGIIEFSGVFSTELIPLLVLNLAAVMILYGFKEQYERVMH
ncbi:MAG: hypothetical protein SV186_02680 [Candidatus Nanohaloarchaea archaeon]|nr:hypothetical protein [Candidatus Nanohaloarchaea archaeon]